MVEMMKTGIPAKDKRALKLARAKLGGHGRAMRKREQMNAVIQAQLMLAILLSSLEVLKGMQIMPF